MLTRPELITRVEGGRTIPTLVWRLIKPAQAISSAVLGGGVCTARTSTRPMVTWTERSGGGAACIGSAGAGAGLRRGVAGTGGLAARARASAGGVSDRCGEDVAGNAAAAGAVTRSVLERLDSELRAKLLSGLRDSGLAMLQAAKPVLAEAADTKARLDLSAR